MKKPLVLLMSVIFLASIFYARKIEITFPKGGEKFCRGKDTIHITWDSEEDLRDALIKISLYKNGNQILKIAENIANTGSYQWPIPDTVSPSDRYQIRVKAKNLPHLDDSEKFQIKICNYPDLVVEEAWVEPKPRTMGNQITYKAKVKNAKTQGLAALAAASKAQLKIYRPQGLSTLTLPPFQVKAFSTLNKMPDTLEYRFVPQAYGIYKYELTLDINNEVEEGDGENNNIDTHHSSVNPGPDLIVCLTGGKKPGACKTTTITAWVRNIGITASAPSTLHMYVKERGTTTHTVPRLAPNEMAHFTRSAKYCAHYGRKTMWAHINKDNSVIETNYDNNYVKTMYCVAQKYCVECYAENPRASDLGYTEIAQLACCSVKKNQ